MWDMGIDIFEYKKLEIMYKIWKAGKLKKYQQKAREGMLEYDWDNVYKKYWRPFLKVLEDDHNRVWYSDFLEFVKKEKNLIIYLYFS
jgi:hypothetical protein